MSKLTGAQWGQLSQILNDAFPVYQDLQILLNFEMGLKLPNISQPQAMPFVLYDVIQYTEARNLTTRLVEAARRLRPDNTDLFAFAQQIGVAPATPANLEAILSKQNIVFDIVKFRTKVAELEGRVCCIEINGEPRGTGFLVGPSAVLTNYHVMQDVIKEQPGYTPADVRLRFDYKRLEDGTTINSGTIHTLAQDWLVDASPSSAVDKQPEPKPGDPNPDELDYALLRVDGRPGEETASKVPPTPAGSPPPRGFVPLPASGKMVDFASNAVLFIAQHPQGYPMKLTVNTFRSQNGNGYPHDLSQRHRFWLVRLALFRRQLGARGPAPQR